MKKEKLLQGKRACIFDLDGTLFDSLGIWSEIDARFFAMHGKQVPEDYNQRIAHKNFHDIALFTKEEYGFKESVPEMMKIWDDWSKEAYQKKIQTKPGAREFVKELYDKGFALAVVTSNRRELYEPCLVRNGIYDCFSVLLNTNDLNTTKADPFIFEEASRRLKVPASETLVFDDVSAALKAAKDAGYTTVGIYDKINLPDIENILKYADTFLGSFLELK